MVGDSVNSTREMHKLIFDQHPRVTQRHVRRPEMKKVSEMNKQIWPIRIRIEIEMFKIPQGILLINPVQSKAFVKTLKRSDAELDKNI